MIRFKMALCYMLTVVTLLSFMMISTSALFKDQAKIQHKEAVNTLTEMHIVNGNKTGYFDPTGYVTRADLCKMIYLILNGGNDLHSYELETNTYKDIEGHWAEGYIEYCSNLGIVSGYANNIFAPNEYVTGEQAVKIMLGAMNYDSSAFKFTGANWTYYVKAIATQAGLYQDVFINDSAPICRDDAAQLIYNGIMLPTVQYNWSEDPITGTPIKGYTLTGRALYAFNRDWMASTDFSSSNSNIAIDTETTEYGAVFLSLLGKSIGDAHDKFGQPIETICYNTKVLESVYYGDVYPYFTVIYTPIREIKMINLTSAGISVLGCNYGMDDSQIMRELGYPSSILDDNLNKKNIFVYRLESGEKKLIIKFLDHTYTAIKNIHFSLAE